MLNACHSHEVEVYDSLLVDIRAGMLSRQEQYRTIKQVECLLGLITGAIDTNTTIGDDELGDCGSEVSVESLVIDFPSPSTPDECPAPHESDPACEGLPEVVEWINGHSADDQRGWVLITEDAVGEGNNCGEDATRLLDFPDACSGGAPFHIRIETQDSNEWVEFKTDTCVFDAALEDMNVEIYEVTASNPSINDNSQFCKACSSSSERYGDSCWGVVTDGHRSCGCNSGGWSGAGMYYGGHSNPTRCGSWPGSFSGFRGNGQQKGSVCNNGMRLLMQQSLTAQRPTTPATLLSGNAHCPDCTCELSETDPHWNPSSNCHSMFDDDLRWGGGPGLHLRNGASFTLTFPGPMLVDHIDLQQIQNHGNSYWRGDFTIDTFNDGTWTTQALVADLAIQELQALMNQRDGNGYTGLFQFQLAAPVRATKVRMSAGNPQRGNGEIFRLEELQVYGWAA